MRKNEKLKWYDNARIITLLIVLVVVIAIIVSQSFAVTSGGLTSFSSVINHNSIYFFVLIYFALISIKIGKKYFNYLNIYLVFIYLLYLVASLLTLIQSFGLNTFINLLINTSIFIYLSHTMFRDTRIWKDFSLDKSPFNEITNEGYFCTIVILLVFNLIVNLISTVVLNGLFISIIDSLYLLLFIRYIYLYFDYLDSKKININNKGNFDKIKSSISEKIDEVGEALDDVVDIIKDVDEEILDDKSDSKKKKGDDK